MKVVPQAFWQSADVEKILVDGLSCILYKRADQPNKLSDRHVSASAFTIVLKGSLQVVTDTGVNALIKAGSLVFLPKGLYMVSDLIPEDSYFEALVLFFDDQLIQKFVATKNHKPMAEGGPLTPLTFQCPSSVLTFSDALFRIYRNQSLPELTKIKLVEFLHLLTAARPEVMESLCRAQNQPRRNLKAFMLAHFNKPLSVENFADLTGRSVSTFHRDFKEQFEMTPKKWLIRKRLEFARQMLIAQEKKKVSEIAWNAGFEDVPHFVKTFTQHYHISPKQLAIKMRRGALI